MSGKLHIREINFQPPSFAFTPENLAEAERIVAKYPVGWQQSAVMPLLTLAQNQHANWLPKAAMDVVAEMLGMPPVRVYEVASFYTMYNLAPVGRYMIEICTTTPCWLAGSDAIVRACEKRLGIKLGETTGDGQFTLREAECLGACVNAPMCQVGEHYYEDLTPDNVISLIDSFARGGTPTPGPQSGRKSSEPLGAPSSKAKVESGTAVNQGSHVSSKTASDTAQAAAPGKHQEGQKRYSAETNAKKGEGDA